MAAENQFQLEACLIEASDNPIDYRVEWIDSGKGEFQSRFYPNGNIIPRPERTNRCACGLFLEDPDKPCFIYNTQTHRVLTLCDECYETFASNKTESRKCTSCGAVHRNRIGTRCTSCRGPKVGFGKYKGKYISEVLDSDVSYCRWLLGVTTDEKLGPWIQDHLPIPVADEDLCMPFGKYKDAPLRMLVDDDPKYLLWLRDNATKSPEVVQWIESHLEAINVAADAQKPKRRF